MNEPNEGSELTLTGQVLRRYPNYADVFFLVLYIVPDVTTECKQWNAKNLLGAPDDLLHIKSISAVIRSEHVGDTRLTQWKKCVKCGDLVHVSGKWNQLKHTTRNVYGEMLSHGLQVSDLSVVSCWRNTKQGAFICQLPYEEKSFSEKEKKKNNKKREVSHEQLGDVTEPFDDGHGKKNEILLCKHWLYNGHCHKLTCDWRHTLTSAETKLTLNQVKAAWVTARLQKRLNLTRNEQCTLEAKLRNHGHVLEEEKEDTREKKLMTVLSSPSEQDDTQGHPAVVPGPSQSGYASKHSRAKLFVRWLEDVFGESRLKNIHILDVAGGRGDVSWELCVLRNYMSTVVDPRPVKLNAKQHKYIRKHKVSAELITSYLQRQRLELFTNEILLEQDTTYGLLLGMHPDEATEIIVREAVRHDLPFAVVPCCVFSAENPNRYCQDGTFVKNYETYVKYLLEYGTSDRPIRMTTLPFVGKNLILYRF